MKSNIKTEYDYIIVGAGMSGLAAGIYLSGQGYQVLICEKHNKAGGYVHSFSRKKIYTFDSAVRIVAGAKHGLLADLLDSLEIKNRDFFIELDDIYKTITPNFSFNSGRDLEAFKANLKATFPKNKQDVDAIIDEMKSVYYDVLSVQKNERSILDAQYINKYRDDSFSELLNQFTENNNLKLAISTLWGFFGTIPEDASAIYYSYAILSFFIEKAYYVKGSFDTLTEALTKKFQENGGDLVYRAEVIAINIEEGSASGLVLKRKHMSVSARKGIIASGDILKTVENLVGEIYFPKRYLSKLKKLTLPFSVFQTYLATDLKKEQLDLAHENFYFADRSNSDIRSSFSNLEVDISSFSISAPSLIDGSLTVDNSTLLVLSTFVPYSVDGGWKNRKKVFEDALIKEASHVIGDLKKHILFQESGTPETMERYTQNSGGSPFGWEQKKEQIFQRPNFATPLDKLYFTGHWTNNGGGIVSAILSSFNLVEYLKKSEKYTSVM